MTYFTKKTLQAGKPGTEKWVKKYGDSLICVRYKYDPINSRKLKTVELLVEDEPWEKNESRIPANKIVSIKVPYGEKNTGILVRRAGGVWNREKRLWELPYITVVNLGLQDRIVKP